MTLRTFLILPVTVILAAGCPANGGESETDSASETTAPTTSTDATTGPTTTDATTTDPSTSDATMDATTDATSDATTDATTTAPTTEATTEDPTTDPPAACACIDTEAYGPGSYTCPGEPACGPVVGFCDVEMDGQAAVCDGFGAFSVEDEVALDCTLDRLIAGELGLVAWNIDSNGPAYSGAFLEVQAGRTGLGRSWEFLDLSGTDSPAGMVELKDAAYFEGCKTKPTPEEKFVCLSNWWKQAPQADCDGAGEVEDF